MRCYSLISVAWVVLLFAVGCSRKAPEPAFTDNSQDTERYAQSIRMMVENQCKLARGGDPLMQLSPLVQELERNDRPVGKYGDVCQSLRNECRAAVDLCIAKEAEKPDIIAHLDAMIKLVSQLPEKSQPSRAPDR